MQPFEFMARFFPGKPAGEPEPKAQKGRSIFDLPPIGQEQGSAPSPAQLSIAAQLEQIQRAAPARAVLPAQGEAYAQDSDEIPLKLVANPTGINEAAFGYLAAQGFMGWQACALMYQHWLVQKACRMPAEDAVRNGWDVASVGGDDLPPDAAKKIKREDERIGIAEHAQNYLEMGRVFGMRIAIYKMRPGEADPAWYEAPFNPEAVREGDYLGIVQVDPQWATPMLDDNASSRPDSAHFYEPTWWVISGRKYHRTHLSIYRHCSMPSILRPAYIYGAMSVPQLIYQRVFQAESGADEGSALLKTKRTFIWKTPNFDKLMANVNSALSIFKRWLALKNNYSVKLAGDGDTLEQHDTALGDVGEVIMTNFQIVAAEAEVPATKLLGTSPKGFSSTGEFEQKSYHEFLESVQTRHLAQFLKGSYVRMLRSALMAYGLDDDAVLVPVFSPLDSPTAKEEADRRLSEAQEAQIYHEMGSIGPEEVRERLATDKASGWHALGLMDRQMPEPPMPAEPLPVDGGAFGG